MSRVPQRSPMDHLNGVGCQKYVWGDETRCATREIEKFAICRQDANFAAPHESAAPGVPAFLLLRPPKQEQRATRRSAAPTAAPRAASGPSAPRARRAQTGGCRARLQSETGWLGSGSARRVRCPRHRCDRDVPCPQAPPGRGPLRHGTREARRRTRNVSPISLLPQPARTVANPETDKYTAYRLRTWDISRTNRAHDFARRLGATRKSAIREPWLTGINLSRRLKRLQHEMELASSSGYNLFDPYLFVA
jgi:hypothetical protein